MAQNRTQVSFTMGSGEQGVANIKLLKEQAERFEVTEAEVLRIALRTLATVDKSIAVLSKKS